MSNTIGGKINDNLNFEQFIDQHYYASDTCHHPTLHTNQSDWLCDPDGTNLMDYVYKVEEYASAIREIEERTNGRVRLKEIQRNKNPKSKSESYRDMYNDRTKAIIAKRFEKDIDLFQYTF